LRCSGSNRAWTEAARLVLDHVGRDSFYGFLASHRRELFHDEDFIDLYCSDNGRPSVPPSLMATALLLQAYEGVSDEEAKARADFDLRWKVALGIGLEERPFAKSTLQLFRARLILHERVRTVFGQSLAFARRTGYFRSRKLKVVLDTSYVLGRGAVKDTYNLLADGITRLARTLATAPTPPVWSGRGSTTWGAISARLLNAWCKLGTHHPIRSANFRRGRPSLSLSLQFGVGVAIEVSRCRNGSNGQRWPG
jgi:hypothetical protein